MVRCVVSRSAVDAEVRVLSSEMASWHGFVAAAWRDRLPVRAGVDAGALVVPPPGPIGEALDLLAARPSSVLGAFGGLVGQVLPAFWRPTTRSSPVPPPVSEAPVRALLDLVRPRVHQEIERGSVLLRRTGGASRAGGDRRSMGPEASMNWHGPASTGVGRRERHLPCCTGILTRPLQCFCSPCAPKATQAA